LNLNEGGAPASYSLRLSRQPTRNVLVTATGSQQAVVGVAPGAFAGSASLTFTPTNWNVPQSVWVRAVDDFVDEVSPHTTTIQHSATKVGGGGLIPAGPNLTVSIGDNDVAGLRIVPTSLDIDE